MSKDGLWVSPAKTELVWFTRKYKAMSLASKLVLKRNTEKRMKRANRAFHNCRKTFRKRLDLRPHVIHWMSVDILRPMHAYVDTAM